MKTKTNITFKMEDLKMRKAIITAGLLVVFGTTAIAQSPTNVEKAKRFRTNQTAATIVTTTASQELNVEKQNIL